MARSLFPFRRRARDGALVLALVGSAATCALDREGQLLFADTTAAVSSSASSSSAGGAGSSVVTTTPASSSVSSSSSSSASMSSSSAGGAGGAGAGGAGGLGGAGGGGDWWDPLWGRRVALTFDSSGSTEDLDGFPVLVKLDDQIINYADVAAGGQDLRFVDQDGTKLDHEIESWDPAGASYVWVEVPTIDAASTTDAIWMYYGNAAAGADTSATAVWGNGYRGVWHLNEQVTDGQTNGVHADATGNGNAGAQNFSDDVTDATGSIARAAYFDGFDDMITVPQAGLQIDGQGLTVQLRAYIISEPNQFPHVLGAGADGRVWQLYWEQNRWAMRLRIGGLDTVMFSNAGAELAWETVAFVYDGAAVRLYRNGVEIDSEAATGNLTPIDGQLVLGDNPVLGVRDFDGYLDEVRIADVARSPSWIAAQHATLSNSFITYGPVETY